MVGGHCTAAWRTLPSCASFVDYTSLSPALPNDPEAMPVYDVGPFLDRLAALADPDGGWGYAPGQPAHLEPTCLGLLALSLGPEGHRGAFDKAHEALERSAAGDGTYRLQRGRDEAVWPTALVLFTRAALGTPPASLSATAGALLGLRGRLPEQDVDHEVHDIDLRIVGWPWAAGNFSWVEPTAWACLALRRAGHGGHERVREGLRLLLDRTFDEGGINYGNRHILGKPLEPVPGPTAVSLLALQGRGDEPRIRASVRYLLGEGLGDDLEHLCWARLALAAHADQPGVREALAGLAERILAAHAARPQTPYLQPAPLREALTALALAADRVCPFVIQPVGEVCNLPVPEAG